MPDKNNAPKTQKKIGPITINKKNIIKALAVAGIIGSCAFGINNYLSYKHQVFLEEHSIAIADIENKNSQGYQKSFNLLKQLAEDDYATPQDYFYLAYIYQYGLGTQKDYSNAYKYYQKAANDNYVRANYQIALLYKNGHGVNKDDNKTIDYLTKAYNLGYKNSLITLTELIEANNRLISVVEPNLLYEIYLGYKSNQITNLNQDSATKYLTTAAAEGYEPAIIIQAQNFSKSGDNYRALMLWQTLLYSSNSKVSKLAKKEIIKVEKLVKQQREQEQAKQKELQQAEQIKQQKAEELKQQRQKQIQYKRKVGLTVPKKELNNLNGLIYLNLFKVNKNLLQNFYHDIADIKVDASLLKNPDNIDSNYINNFMTLSKLKHNKSSLRIDFGDLDDNNKYEGIIYYFYNDKDKLTQDIVNSVIKNLNPKRSSLLPVIIDAETGLPEIETPEDNKNGKTKHYHDETPPEVQKQKPIELTHEEKIQRMQVFAQKGDYKEFYKLEQAAKAGDVYAIYYVGEYYYNNKDYADALKYYKEAAAKNYGPAYYKLASLYYNEEKNGVPYDKQKAMYYYQKAAELGVRNAKHVLMLIK